MSTDDPLSSDIVYPHWQNEYAAAMLETNSQDISGRVEAAETAIYNRLQELSQDTDHHTERHVIEDALALRFSRRRIQDSPTGERSDYAAECLGSN